ncbi:MAG: hypothetical protein EU541_06235 [Promethearchaeota archaeon]|nr:MAG: hypothetical protein EU541_06235 [Candidatus Lokiarchaeota archaeon]
MGIYKKFHNRKSREKKKKDLIAESKESIASNQKKLNRLIKLAEIYKNNSKIAIKKGEKPQLEEYLEKYVRTLQEIKKTQQTIELAENLRSHLKLGGVPSKFEYKPFKKQSKEEIFDAEYQKLEEEILLEEKESLSEKSEKLWKYIEVSEEDEIDLMSKEELKEELKDIKKDLGFV